MRARPRKLKHDYCLARAGEYQVRVSTCVTMCTFFHSKRRLEGSRTCLPYEVRPDGLKAL